MGGRVGEEFRAILEWQSFEMFQVKDLGIAGFAVRGTERGLPLFEVEVQVHTEGFSQIL